MLTARQVLSQRLPEPQVHVAGRGKTDLAAVRAANGVAYAYEDKPDGLRASPTTVEVWDVCGDGRPLEPSILKHVGDADGVARRWVRWKWYSISRNRGNVWWPEDVWSYLIPVASGDNT